MLGYEKFKYMYSNKCHMHTSSTMHTAVFEYIQIMCIFEYANRSYYSIITCILWSIELNHFAPVTFTFYTCQVITWLSMGVGIYYAYVVCLR